MFENGYDAVVWYDFYIYKLMWAVTSVNTDADAQAQCGLDLNKTHGCVSYTRPFLPWIVYAAASRADFMFSSD